MAEELTEQQREAVYNRGGRLLVSAAAGSGKTKVLGDRLMSYLEDPVAPANIDDFLLITYTKAAAAELRGKIAAKLSERVALQPDNAHLQRQLQRLYMTKISTVHGFCSDILREYAFELDLPGDFRVADEDECNEIRYQVMEKILTNAYETQMENVCFRTFVDSQGLGRDDRQIPQIVLQVYDSARCHLDPHHWLENSLDRIQMQGVTDAAQTPYGEYLVSRLHRWLETQIQIMQDCVGRLQYLEGVQTAIQLLAATVEQLEKLRAATTWEEIRQCSNVQFGTLRFPKKCDDPIVDEVKAARAACKDGLKKQLKPFSDSSEQILKDLASSAEAAQGLVELVYAFWEEFEKAKRSRRILDFSDLEHKILDLFLGKKRNTHTHAAAEVGDRFREVMVDEYQDSNEVQDAIYAALTDRRNNLFLVGDVKQSIYQFRLADPDIFTAKYQKFLPFEQATAGEDRKVILGFNFRSGEGVLEACNDVFSLCMSPQVGGMYYGKDEALYAKRIYTPTGKPEVELHCIDVQEQTYPEEAGFVANQIRRMIDSGEAKAEDIAILLRSPGSAGSYFQQALERCGIRYATGGGVDLLATEEIGTLRSILQVIHNPRLDIPLVAALLSPVFGFTADDLAAIRAPHKSCLFYDALRRDPSPKSKAFMETLLSLREMQRHCNLSALVEQVLIATSLEELYGAMDQGKTRLENLQSFYQMVVNYEAGGNCDLGRFLDHLDALEENGLVTAGDQGSVGAVTIMSIHKSKGLEFPVVFLCGLGRKFNTQSQRAAILCHKEMGLGMAAVDNEKRLRYPTIAKRAIAVKIAEESVSEELRVLYVAMTRARDRLIMTYASNNLEKELTDMVQRMKMNGTELLAQEANCPGDWVLLTALQKTEAGQLHHLAGTPAATQTGNYPWKITVDTFTEQTTATEETENVSRKIPEEVLAGIGRSLSFEYPHAAATMAASKLTATGLKGRYKDEEAAEQTPISTGQYRWRKPHFVSNAMEGKDYGNVIHRVMQYIQFENCTDLPGVEQELCRLREQNFLTEEQAEAVDPKIIFRFFATELGGKIAKGQVVREFKFSVLQDGAVYDPLLAGEGVLLQGVVDCALLEPDGITIVDFKTDRVTEQTLPEKVAAYAQQVNAYAGAMEQIYEKPIKAKLLYFFHLGRFVPV